jgi:hypothetical protein
MSCPGSPRSTNRPQTSEAISAAQIQLAMLKAWACQGERPRTRSGTWARTIIRATSCGGSRRAPATKKTSAGEYHWCTGDSTESSWIGAAQAVRTAKSSQSPWLAVAT